MYKIKKKYYSNFSFDIISDLVKNGTIFTTVNTEMKLVESKDNMFFLSFVLNPSRYIHKDIDIPSLIFNANIEQHNIIINDNYIEVYCKYTLDNNMLFYQNIKITNKKIKTVFSYSLNKEHIFYKYIINIIATYGLNEFGKCLIGL